MKIQLEFTTDELFEIHQCLLTKITKEKSIEKKLKSKSSEYTIRLEKIDKKILDKLFK